MMVLVMVLVMVLSLLVEVLVVCIKFVRVFALVVVDERL